MNKGVVIAVLVLLGIAVAAYQFGNRSVPPASNAAPSDTNATHPDHSTGATTDNTAPATPESVESNRNASSQPATEPQVAKAEPQTAPAPKGFCERDLTDIAAREADAAELQANGGLVRIFEREAELADPYGCADFYLQHGLDIDAVDLRPDHEKLTGLFFAIQRNDPKMLNFMIDQDADLKKRAGKNDIRALGYAYYLALNDTRINRNEVIGILDSTLTQQAASGAQGNADSR